MIKRILVPIDFSECSTNALKYAANLAKKMKAEELQIMHAYTSPVAYSEVGAYYNVEALDFQTQRELKDRFEEVKSEVSELEEVVHEFTIQNTFVVEALQKLCSSKRIDLVVMGTKGASGLEEVFFGSTTYATIKNCKFPVLVIPSGADYKQIHNVALASDYKEIDIHVLEPLKHLNKAFMTNIHIVHISKDEELTNKEIHEAKKYEQFLHNIPHQFHYIVNDDVEKGLTEYVQTHNIDMVTVVPRKHSFYEMIFGLGKSKPIIFHTELPLLVLPE